MMVVETGEVFLIAEGDGNDRRILGYASTRKEAESFCGNYNSQPGKRNHKWYIEPVFILEAGKPCQSLIFRYIVVFAKENFVWKIKRVLVDEYKWFDGIKFPFGTVSAGSAIIHVCLKEFDLDKASEIAQNVLCQKISEYEMLDCRKDESYGQNHQS